MNHVEIGRYTPKVISDEDRANGCKCVTESWQGWIKTEKFTVFVTADGRPVVLE